MKVVLLISAFLIISTSAISQTSPEAGEMKVYYLVLLKKGPQRNQDSVTAKEIQEGHMAHLDRMYSEGKLDLAGPLMEDGDIRGICVYNVQSEEEARTLAEQDPAIRAGRLVAEIHPWYAMKGSSLK